MSHQHARQNIEAATNEIKVHLDTKHLLYIADDCEQDRQMISQLQVYCPALTQTRSVTDAIELLSSNHFDAVILTASISVEDLRAFSESLAERVAIRDIPIVLMHKVNTPEPGSELLESLRNCSLTSAAVEPVVLLSQLSVAIRNHRAASRLREENNSLAQWRHLHDDDMETASKLMDSILGNPNYRVDNMRTHLQPMETLNGDIVLATNKPDGGQHFIIGDFTGHGMPAALGTVIVVDTFYTMTLKGFSIAEIARELNQKLFGMLPTGRFLSACLIEVQEAKQGISIWNAGLPDVMLVRKAKGIVHRARSQNLPLGILDSKDFSPAIETIAIEAGDRIYAYSDGLIEAANHERTQFGQTRLNEVLNTQHSAETVFLQVLGELDSFCGNAPREDDITFVEVQLDAVGNTGKELTTRAFELSKPTMSWQFDMTLDTDALKNIFPIPILITMLVDVQGMKNHRERLYTVLAELFNNALDHGLLELDSSMKSTAEGFTEYYDMREKRLQALSDGKVAFSFNCHPREQGGGELHIGIQQSHNGFDHAKVMHKLDTNTAAHGRGILLVRSICEQVTYSDEGRRVDVCYAW